MENRLLSGVWRFMVSVPPGLWEKQILKNKAKITAAQRSMSADHRRVHHFAVAELPRRGKPLPADIIAANLDLSLDRVNEILANLEKRLTYLFRDDAGDVVWAYPVTVEKTPHRITLDSGETLYAA